MSLISTLCFSLTLHNKTQAEVQTLLSSSVHCWQKNTRSTELSPVEIYIVDRFALIRVDKHAVPILENCIGKCPSHLHWFPFGTKVIWCYCDNIVFPCVLRGFWYFLWLLYFALLTTKSLSGPRVLLSTVKIWRDLILWKSPHLGLHYTHCNQ